MCINIVACFLFKGQLEQVQLSAPSVVVKNKALNLTTVLRPSNVGTVTYYWWFDNKTEVSLTFLFSAMLFITWMKWWIHKSLCCLCLCLLACSDPGWRDVFHLLQGRKSYCHCSGFSRQYCPPGPNYSGSLWWAIFVFLILILLFLTHSNHHVL